MEKLCALTIVWYVKGAQNMLFKPGSLPGARAGMPSKARGVWEYLCTYLAIVPKPAELSASAKHSQQASGRPRVRSDAFASAAHPVPSLPETTPPSMTPFSSLA